tara:strand:+ start:691 stop:1269 length:579 start_codon:yes stop_codon:yes gene_type:complete
MKLFLLFIFLFYSSLIKAEEINSFELEGFSIGDSLLNFYSKNEILENIEKDTYGVNKGEYKIKDIYLLTFYKDLEKYEEIQFYIKRNDNKFIIQGIDGLIEVKNIKKCDEEIEKISKQLVNIFEDNGSKIGPLNHHVATDSIWWGVEFSSIINGRADITCSDWSDEWTREHGWADSLRVGIMNSFISKKFGY